MSNYQITLLEYACTDTFPDSMLYSGFGGDPAGIHPLTYMIGVLESNSDLIVVDTGYDPENPEAYAHMQKEAHKYFRSPAEVLKKTGVHPEDVRHVILTHAHWDHMGGITYFPNAVFYLQKEELLQWVYTLSLPHEYDVLKSATKYADIEACISLLKEGRLVLLDGDVDELFPGIDIKVARNGHSFASNLVVIQTENGKYVYSGDTVYVRENLTGLQNSGVSLPNGYAIGSTFQSIHTMQQILDLVDRDTDHVIICHDIKTWDIPGTILTDDNLHMVSLPV